MENMYRIRRKTSAQEVDVQGDRDFVVKQFERLWEKESSVAPRGDTPGTSTGEGAQSMVEYVNSLSPRSHTETVVAIAGHLFHQGQREFTLRNVDDGFRETMRASPGNTSQTIRNAIKRGYIMKAGKKDGLTAYSLTRSGLEETDTRFGRSS